MRGLVWVTVVLAGLWGGWWLVGSRGVKAAAEGWFAEQTALGREASYAELSVAGFPSRLDLTVTEPMLGDPATGLGWRAPFAQVFAMTWKPWHLIAALPGGQVFRLPGGEVTLDGNRMMGSLLLVPGADLALSEAVAEGEALALAPGLGALRGAERVVVSIRADQTREHGYRIGANLRGLGLDAVWAAGAGLPAEIAEGYLDATADLSAAIDRHAAETRPALQRLDLTASRLVWGELNLSATGQLAADAAGFAAGQIDIRVENWRLLPPLLVATGTITADFAPTLTRGLEVMAEQGGEPEVLTLPLVARDGTMSLGPLPLGPAPYWGVRSDG